MSGGIRRNYRTGLLSILSVGAAADEIKRPNTHVVDQGRIIFGRGFNSRRLHQKLSAQPSVLSEVAFLVLYPLLLVHR